MNQNNLDKELEKILEDFDKKVAFNMYSKSSELIYADYTDAINK